MSSTGACTSSLIVRRRFLRKSKFSMPAFAVSVTPIALTSVSRPPGRSSRWCFCEKLLLSDTSPRSPPPSDTPSKRRSCCVISTSGTVASTSIVQPPAPSERRARAPNNTEPSLSFFMGCLPEVDDETDLRRRNDGLERGVLREPDLQAVRVLAVDGRGSAVERRVQVLLRNGATHV